jgi:hypothetical protein
MDSLKKNDSPSPPKQEASVTEEDEAMSICEETMSVTESPAPTAAPALKKKKKKASYKSMMTSMMKETNNRDGQKERQALQGLGGGAFSKIEKI